jgi:hypothetical protein
MMAIAAQGTKERAEEELLDKDGMQFCDNPECEYAVAKIVKSFYVRNARIGPAL